MEDEINAIVDNLFHKYETQDYLNDDKTTLVSDIYPSEHLCDAINGNEVVVLDRIILKRLSEKIGDLDFVNNWGITLSTMGITLIAFD